MTVREPAPAIYPSIVTSIPANSGRLLPDEEHPGLVSAATEAIGLLRGLRESLEPSEGGAIWMHHYEFADRAGDLADHLDTALDAVTARRYPSAFALIRTAMEHQVLDRLLLLADRYRERFEKLSDDEFDRWQKERAAGAAWAADVEDLERRGQGAVVVRRGHDVRDASGAVVERISPYWPVVERHRPTLGPPSAQAEFFDGIGDLADHEKWARVNRDRYRDFLRWEAMLDNLVLNELIPEHERVRLEVHYRFLSAFTHATRHGYDTIGRSESAPSPFRPSSHHLSELALLYVAAIAATELKSFCEFVDRRRELIGFANRSEIGSLLDRLQLVGGHLWYVGQMPSEFDRFVEANKRVWQTWDTSGPIPADRQRPGDIPPHEIGYYTDPLDRLHQMHIGGNEMTTGFSHRPMW